MTRTRQLPLVETVDDRMVQHTRGDERLHGAWMEGPSMRRMTGLAIMAMIALGCSAAAESDRPSISAPPTGAAPSPTTTPDPTSPSAPATTLDISWTADDPIGLPDVFEIVDVAQAGDRYVLVTKRYENEGFASAAWSSADGRTWELAQAFPADQRILALTAGGPGFAVAGADDAGAIVWTTADGRQWTPVTDASLRRGVIGTLVPTKSGLIAFGWRSDTDGQSIWTSADGSGWLAATNETGLAVARGLQAVGAYDGRAVAFVSQGEGKPSAIWETTGRAEWTRTGALTDVASPSLVTGGARGWVALGSNLAWTSSDGRSWSSGVPGPDVAADAIVDEAGFVAVGWVGSLPGETCGDQRPFAGHTWSSADGQAWEQMPVTDEFEAAMVTRVLLVDRTLVGYGGRIGSAGGDDMRVGRWTAPLPDDSRPADASDEGSVSVGCGG